MKHPRSAFATMLAIVMLAMVTVALAALVTVLRIDHVRTVADLDQAQLRQMILAAVIDTDAKAVHWTGSPSPQNWTLDLPASGGSVKMDLSTVSPNRVDVSILASVGKKRSSQMMHFSRVDSRWQLEEIVLEEKHSR